MCVCVCVCYLYISSGEKAHLALEELSIIFIEASTQPMRMSVVVFYMTVSLYNKNESSILLMYHDSKWICFTLTSAPASAAVWYDRHFQDNERHRNIPVDMNLLKCFNLITRIEKGYFVCGCCSNTSVPICLSSY